MPLPSRIVVMGVSGTGKSAVGAALAESLRLPFVEGDELHPRANIAKMAAGSPLTDADRWPWLRSVAEAIRDHPLGCVATCSALRIAYRDVLRERAPGVLFVHLAASAPVLAERMRDRDGHFMPPSLLDSQLRTLEPLAADEPGFAIGTDAPPVPDVVRAVLARLAAG